MMAYVTQVVFGRFFELLGHVCYTLRFEGLEHLEECELPVIFISNHKSWIDHFIIIAGALRRKGMVPIHVFVADDIWAIPLVGFVCKLLGAHPTQGGSGLHISLEPLEQHLAKGKCVGLYPEGGIEKGYNSFRGPRPGAAYLALKTGRQLLPMAIKGLEKFTWSSLFFGGRRVTIRFGRPFVMSGNFQDRTTVEVASQTIMKRITEIYHSIKLAPHESTGVVLNR